MQILDPPSKLTHAVTQMQVGAQVAGVEAGADLVGLAGAVGALQAVG